MPWLLLLTDLTSNAFIHRVFYLLFGTFLAAWVIRAVFIICLVLFVLKKLNIK
ncbi:hypothetical protein [Companilactobacillus mishanensis]|uniref:hypothetical protein n=1 Tax=Companilactobacillus mishanensis TaxID=2486008 RepID=UPI001296246B|nr:hypothetical protein [Companilactobacillus mishanensis]